ncbi:hypothetical protein QNH39_12720 [Neobacillus novalis]|uniref:Uncharacterized protein n=1 Tax=Neobacillus novalis TaxID=220687 RepID=A0AA95MWG1_9BACI|nr:hypothetical protein [Neobacillus novalis]WHY88641.1 hypothetical protein QNH39_12720 [Neobacillus novalis]
MKIFELIGISILVFLILLLEWRKLYPNQKKEKRLLVTLTAISLLLAILLLYFPEIPGPTQMISSLFFPLGKMLK